jgi:hypothetical protein
MDAVSAHNTTPNSRAYPIALSGLDETLPSMRPRPGRTMFDLRGRGRRKKILLARWSHAMTRVVDHVQNSSRDPDRNLDARLSHGTTVRREGGK